jgi:hypothetical protein
VKKESENMEFTGEHLVETDGRVARAKREAESICDGVSHFQRIKR